MHVNKHLHTENKIEINIQKKILKYLILHWLLKLNKLDPQRQKPGSMADRLLSDEAQSLWLFRQPSLGQPSPPHHAVFLMSLLFPVSFLREAQRSQSILFVQAPVYYLLSKFVCTQHGGLFICSPLPSNVLGAE